MTDTEDLGTDRPVCSWEQADGSLCLKPEDETMPLPEGAARRCVTHNEPRFRVCAGCAAEPSRTCGPACSLSLCTECRHQPDETHSKEQPGPFAGQRATNDPMNQARRQMVDDVAAALRRCATTGLVSFPTEDHPERVAGVIIDDQTVKALMRIQEGLAMAQGGRRT